LNHGANLHPIAGGKDHPLVDSMTGFEPDQGFTELDIRNGELFADFDGRCFMI
jgi:hypothetical protein